MALFIFIGGPSAGGKTGVTEQLLEQLKKENISAQKLNMDDYYKERPNDIEIDYYRNNTNFDVPNMLHLDLFQEHVQALGQDKQIIKPKFSFLTNKREGDEKIFSSECIIVEGLFAQLFYQKYLPENFPALNININAEDYSHIIKRRKKRDVESRGRTEKEIMQQEHRYVGPGFFKYTAHFASGSDLYINNKQYSDPQERAKQLELIVEEIQEAIKLRKEELEKASILFERRKRPDVRALVAQSHFQANRCNDDKFIASFSGSFGEPEGLYEEDFSPKLK